MIVKHNPMSHSAIITEARSWIGTRFVHQGRVKKSVESQGGCDCIGLIIGVATACNIKCKGIALSGIDNKNYSRNPDGINLRKSLDEYLIQVAIEYIHPGDVLLMRINKHPQHVAFVGDYANGGLSLIHCHTQARGVVEHVLDDYWAKRVVAGYRLG
jgi:cell wall-associated NlpC family hydrolase